MALWKDEGERDFGEGMDVIPGARVFGKEGSVEFAFFQEGGDRLCRSFLHAALDARMVRKEAGDEGKDGWQ
jgi:hypothetical protein